MTDGQRKRLQLTTARWYTRQLISRQNQSPVAVSTSVQDAIGIKKNGLHVRSKWSKRAISQDHEQSSEQHKSVTISPNHSAIAEAVDGAADEHECIRTLQPITLDYSRRVRAGCTRLL